jgi:hypothetical protein
MIAIARLVRERWQDILFGAALFAASTGGWACGFEDPNSVGFRRGALNMAFPQALHVGTAMWQAQMAGALPRDELARRDDLTEDARRTLSLLRINGDFRKLAARLGGAPGAMARPNLAIVLLGSVLWTRIETQDGVVLAKVHVDGPSPGEVVIVTDAPALKAIAGGDVGFAQAVDLGVVRLYGPPVEVAAARIWLAALDSR